MKQQAKINSIVMLKDLRASLAKFAETASTALDEVGSEIQRTVTWLREDRRRHWTKEVRLRHDAYVQAKLALKRKGIFDMALSGMRSSAIDEKKALAIAERRLREAERRLARTRTWIMQLEKELSDYRAATQGLGTSLDSDIPNARARLEKMVESLEAYVTLAPPEMMRSSDEQVGTGSLDSDGSTVLRAPGQRPADQASIENLRELTPAASVRAGIALGSGECGWIADLKPSEALCQAARNNAIEPGTVQPDDKVVLAPPQGEPDIVYLERTASQAGDSGWYIGTETRAKADECGAMRVADLIAQCPGFESILDLPVDSLVVIDFGDSTETLYDAQNNRLWPEADSRSEASEQPPEPEDA